MFNVEQFALNHHAYLRAAEYNGELSCVKKIRPTEEIEPHEGAIQKIVLDLTADQEYTYHPDAGPLKAYEKHDAQFLLHLLPRGIAAPA